MNIQRGPFEFSINGRRIKELVRTVDGCLVEKSDIPFAIESMNERMVLDDGSTIPVQRVNITNVFGQFRINKTYLAKEQPDAYEFIREGLIKIFQKNPQTLEANGFYSIREENEGLFRYNRTRMSPPKRLIEARYSGVLFLCKYVSDSHKKLDGRIVNSSGIF